MQVYEWHKRIRDGRESTNEEPQRGVVELNQKEGSLHQEQRTQAHPEYLTVRL
jgi:hypothetical protein